jgi:hypothetical protein
LAAVAAVFAALVPGTASAITIPVTGPGTNDNIANDGVCSIREAVIAGNTNTASADLLNPCPAGAAGPDSVSLPAGTFVLDEPGEAPNQEDPTGGDLDLNRPSALGAGTETTGIQGVSPAATTIRQTAAGQRVIHASGYAAVTILSHLSITGGSLAGTGNTVEGGGILDSPCCYDAFSGPRIHDVRIHGNSISNTGGGGGQGGGIRVSNFGGPYGPTLQDVTVFNNSVNVPGNAYGGGISGSGAFDRVRVHDNTLTTSGFAYGGGIAGGSTITNAVVSGNRATSSGPSLGTTIVRGAEGGGLFAGGSTTVSDSTITDNLASAISPSGATGRDAIGGGLAVASGSVGYHPNLTNLTIENNAAQASGEARGGGVALGSAADLSFVTLRHNSASGASEVDEAAANYLLRWRASAIDAANPASACGGISFPAGTFASAGANAETGSTCWPTNAAGDIQNQGLVGLGLGPLADHTGGAAGKQAGATGFKTAIRTRQPTSVLIDNVSGGAAGCTNVDGGTVTVDARGGSRPQDPNCDTGAHELTVVRDADGDGVTDASDNCPNVANAGQANNDPDAKGDACDPDDDNDGVPDSAETGCPGGGIATDADSDNDGIDDGPDAFPCDSGTSADGDGDGIDDAADNCRDAANAGQENNDGDGEGDKCDPDDDNDDVPDATETGCPGGGVSTDSDSDNDGVLDGPDAFPCDAADSADSDGDGIGDNGDNCPADANPGQANNDGDSEGDACDADDDNDGIDDGNDPDPFEPAIATDAFDDVVAVDGVCTLREAVIAANTDTATSSSAAGECPAGTGPGDVVSVPAGTFELDEPGEPHNQQDLGFGGDLDLVDGTSLQGAGPNQTTIEQTASNQRVIQAEGAPTGLVLSGLTIMGGELNINSNVVVAGGGVYLPNGSPDLEDVRVSGNTISGSGGGGGSVNGAGIYVLASEGGQSTLTDVSVVDNEITFNGSTAQGAGLWAGAFGCCQVVLTRTTIAENDSSVVGVALGGGAYLDRATVDKSVIDDNSVSSTTTANSAGSLGGGVYADVNGINVSDSTITNNDATATGTNTDVGGLDAAAGGLYAGGGNFTNLTIAGNTVTATDEARGGGLASRGGADFSFVTLSGNTASGGAVGGHAAASLGSGSVLRWRASAIDSAAPGSACGTGTSGADSTGRPSSGGSFTSAGANADAGNTCWPSNGANDIQNLGSGSLGLGTLDDHTGGAAGYQAGADGFRAPIQTQEPVSGGPLFGNVPGGAPGCTNADGAVVTSDARGRSRPNDANCETGAHERTGVGPDGDGDGIGDDDDDCPNGAAAGTDTDGDGCKDAGEDSDDDNDGIPDASDPDPLVASINVTAGSDDTIAIDGECTLREAVIAANTDTATSSSAAGECPAGTGPGDVVNVPAGTFELDEAGEGHSGVDATGGDLDLNDGTAIEGVSPADTTIEQTASNQRVIHSTSSTTGTILSDLSITGGNLTSGGGFVARGAGGGILIDGGTPDLEDVRVAGNDLSGSFPNGAGILLFPSGSGRSNVTDVSVTDNDLIATFGFAQGGGIWAEAGGSNDFLLTRVRLNDNDVHQGYGGGAYLSRGFVNQAVVDNNTVTSSIAGSAAQGAYGAGIFAFADGISMTDSTITNNTATNTNPSTAAAAGGAGLTVNGATFPFGNFTNLTIADNSAVASGEALGGGVASTEQTPADFSFVTLSGNTASGSVVRSAAAVMNAGHGAGTKIRWRASAIDSPDPASACGSGTDAGASTSGGTFASAGANAESDSTCWPANGANDVQNLGSGGLGLGSLADHTGGAAAYQAGATGFKAPIETREPDGGGTLFGNVPGGGAGCTNADGAVISRDARGRSRPNDGNCETGAHERTGAAPDSDADGIVDDDDACPNGAAAGTDSDGDGCKDAGEDSDDDNDGVDDVSDAFPLDPGESADSDGDGVADNSDDCPTGAAGGTDSDGDGCKDADEDSDDDNDGVEDTSDAFPLDDTETSDGDGDGTGDNSDNCPADTNPGQANNDGDSEGDACDTDDDNDGVDDTTDLFPFDATETADGDGDGDGDNSDNCPADANPGQANNDADSLGDACDPDDDNDGVDDVNDTFPFDPTESGDNDGDGIRNNADSDDDNDGVDDVNDPFPRDHDDDGADDSNDRDDDNDGIDDLSDAFPHDHDNDGIDDSSDPDDDNDGVPDASDSFPRDSGESVDHDKDGIGDNADSDDDADGIEDAADPFPLDHDNDGIPDGADTDDDGDDVADEHEVFPLDHDNDGIDDGSDADDDDDGVDDADDAFPFNSGETTDTDGDGSGDNADPDDDNDGVPDSSDNCRLTAGPASSQGCPAAQTSTPPSASSPARGDKRRSHSCHGRKATIVGTKGDDRLKGTRGRDVIVGLDGNDVLIGRGERDLLCGGSNDDVIYGGSGPDALRGGPGSDLLFGGPERDFLIGGSPGSGESTAPGVSDRCPKAHDDRHEGCVLD